MLSHLFGAHAVDGGDQPAADVVGVHHFGAVHLKTCRFDQVDVSLVLSADFGDKQAVSIAPSRRAEGDLCSWLAVHVDLNPGASLDQRLDLVREVHAVTSGMATEAPRVVVTGNEFCRGAGGIGLGEGARGRGTGRCGLDSF